MNAKDAIKNYLERNSMQSLDIQAALIDMDGVLFDTMPNHAIAWTRLFTELGVDMDPKEIYLYEGMTAFATINIMFKRQFGKEVSKEESDRLYNQKIEYFGELDQPAPMKDADKMLKALSDHNIKRVLVTGSGQHTILDRISSTYPGMFDEDKRITSREVKHGKPNPEPYLMGAGKVNLDPKQCMVIENAPLGVQAGHGAGCFTVGITTGPIPEEELYKAGADIVFPSMPDFAKELPNLINCFRSTKL